MNSMQTRGTRIYLITKYQSFSLYSTEKFICRLFFSAVISRHREKPDMGPVLRGHGELHRAVQYAVDIPSILAEAGYPDGIDLDLEVANKATYIAAGQVIQVMAAQAGAAVTLF
jgi:hypothetical protein